MVTPLFQISGTTLSDQHWVIFLCRSVLSIGQFFSIIIDSWSKGQAEELDLHLLIDRATAWYVGGVIALEEGGGFKGGIQLGG